VSASVVPQPRTVSVSALFEEKPPVLVEIRFPGMATSPDWYFCREEEELETIRSRLGPGAEVHLHSVWDLTDPTGGVVIGK
jgi:hypothetical protein